MFKETGKQATKQPNFFFDTCSRRGGPYKGGMETQTSQVAKGEYVCVFRRIMVCKPLKDILFVNVSIVMVFLGTY